MILKHNLACNIEDDIVYFFNFLFCILYSDQQTHKYFTNYYTPTCFDTIVSSSGSL